MGSSNPPALLLPGWRLPQEEQVLSEKGLAGASVTSWLWHSSVLAWQGAPASRFAADPIKHQEAGGDGGQVLPATQRKHLSIQP